MKQNTQTAATDAIASWKRETRDEKKKRARATSLSHSRKRKKKGPNPPRRIHGFNTSIERYSLVHQQWKTSHRQLLSRPSHPPRILSGLVTGALFLRELEFFPSPLWPFFPKCPTFHSLRARMTSTPWLDRVEQGPRRPAPLKRSALYFVCRSALQEVWNPTAAYVG